ncbi:thioesterase family protein [Nocardioides carbamazepini]|uniref:acyl-CoA thioesterase n=1 Tax=Nocardioides carbamazepini TaxID=2854259 RepID=UPI00214A2FE9|nr:thioesterase family protein [Nocardioides carbamazepini]MCR1781977.1 thioesterase family protein [Nocardioides carbamazepini]
MSYLLDDAVTAEPLGDGRYRVRVTADWNTANQTPNGGYVLALLQHAVLLESVHPDALSISITYFRPGLPGPADIAVREVRKGRRVSTYDAVLVQDGKEIAHAVVSTHDWDATGSAEHVPHAAPDVPRPEDCADVSALIPKGMMAILDRYRYRAPVVPGWFRGEPSGVSEAVCWIRTADERPVDALLAGAMVDAFPPATAEIGLLASATIQLTVHYRRRPTGTAWALGHVTARHVIAGYHDEDVELWDEHGRLIAQSRQLAILAEG